MKLLLSQIELFSYIFLIAIVEAIKILELVSELHLDEASA